MEAAWFLGTDRVGDAAEDPTDANDVKSRSASTLRGTPVAGGNGQTLLYRCKGELHGGGSFESQLNASIAACTSLINLRGASPHEAAEGYAWRAVLDVNKRQYDRAIQDASAALKIDPRVSIAYYARGEAYYFINHAELAVPDFDQVMKLPRETENMIPWALVYRGAIFRIAGQYPRAIQDFNRAIELDSDLGMAFYQRGLAERSLGRTADGDRDIREAKRIDPEIRD
jgi:tetratricopeptide (TPR) repeat protein